MSIRLREATDSLTTSRPMVVAIASTLIVVACQPSIEPAASQRPAEEPASPSITPPAPTGAVASGPTTPPPESPPERPAPPPPGGGHFWKPGEWRYEAGSWQWVPGTWEKSRPGEHWWSVRWVKRGATFVAIGGRWRKDPERCEPAPAAPPKQLAVAGGAVTIDLDGDEPRTTDLEVSSFSIDATEVTVGAYASCVKAGQCTEPELGPMCTWRLCGHDDHPITCVTHEQAVAFCRFAGRRLPTEAEWQLAAYGPGAKSASNRTFGPDNTCVNRYEEGTCPVGSHRPKDGSPADMIGNVAEWTSTAPAPTATTAPIRRA